MKVLTDEKKEFTDKIKTSKADMKQKSLDYSDEQDRLAKEQQARINKILKAQAEEEQRELMWAAKEADDSGNHDTAQKLSIAAAKVEIEAVVVTPKPVMAQGQHKRRIWQYKVPEQWHESKMIDGKLVHIVKVDPRYLIINDPLLKQMAVKHKGQAVVDGVEFYQQDVLVTA